MLHVGNLPYDAVESFPASVFELNVPDTSEILSHGKRGREFENDDIGMHDEDNLLDSTDGERDAKRTRFVLWTEEEVDAAVFFIFPLHC